MTYNAQPSPMAPATSRPTSAFITVRDFMSTYGVGRTTVYRLVARGEISIMKIGRASRISRAQAERWAAGLPKLAA